MNKLTEKNITGKMPQNLKEYAPEDGELVLLVEPLRSKQFRVSGGAFIGYFGGYEGKSRFELTFAKSLYSPIVIFANESAYATREGARMFTLPSISSVFSENRYFPVTARKIYVGIDRVTKALRTDKELRALVYPSFKRR